MQHFVFAAGLELVASHGYIANPISRSDLVCEDVYGPDVMGAAFTCMTDRETPAQSPWFSGLPAGVMAGDMPGVAKIYEPVCSGGNDERISQEAISGLNTKGPVEATWRAGDEVSLCWSVHAAHGGVFGYRLCCDGSDSEMCFKQHPMLTVDGKQWIKMTSDVPVTTDWCTQHKVPDDVAGSCTLSWRWDGGCADCAPGQTSESSIFTSCADVSVLPSGSPVPNPTPVPTPKPVPPPTPSPPATCGYASCKDEEVCCCNPTQNVGYCVATGSDPAVCSGSTMCPDKHGCCEKQTLGFLQV